MGPSFKCSKFDKAQLFNCKEKNQVREIRKKTTQINNSCNCLGLNVSVSDLDDTVDNFVNKQLTVSV